MHIVYLSNCLILLSTVLLLFKASFSAIAVGRLEGVIYSVAYAKSDSENESGAKNKNDEKSLKQAATIGEPKEVVSGLFSGVTPGEQAVLLALKSRAQELDGFEKMLYDKENLLAAVDENFELKLNRMKALKDDLIQVLKSYKDIRAKRVNGIVKVYENMKPQEAARIFESLDPDTLLEVVGQMGESKLAPILSRMATSKAKEVTIMLANMYKFKANTKENDCICLS